MEAPGKSALPRVKPRQSRDSGRRSGASMGRMHAACILVVEDDDAIGSALSTVLATAGYDVVRSRSGEEALGAVGARRPDLVLLDLGLPDMDGVDVCRRLRRTVAGLAIVVVTARDDEMDVVLGLEAGADDYVTKPFRLGGLPARLTAVLRRAAAPDGRPLAVGDVEIDPGARSARRDGVPVELRPREFDLLVLLARNAGRVVGREQILTELWRDPWG